MNLVWFDLRRLARRGRLRLVRVLLGLAFLAAIGTRFTSQFPSANLLNLETTYGPSSLLHFAEFSDQFAAIVLVTQFAAVLVLTPALCAPALVEERVRGTLDLLRIGNISPAAIVVSKWWARVMYLGSLLLFSLPVMAFAQLWGGVDPTVILGGYLICGATLMSLAALGFFCSAEAESVTTAIAATYAVAVVFSLLFQWLPWVSPIALVRQWRNPGGPFSYLGSALSYSIVHLALTAVCLAGAALRLHRGGGERSRGFFPLTGSHEAPPAKLDPRLLAPIDVGRFAVFRWPIASFLPQASAIRVFPLPRMGDEPLIWKERFYGGNATAGELLRTTGMIIVLMEMFILVPTYLLAAANRANTLGLQRDWAVVGRPLAVTTLAVTLVTVAAFAAGSVARERDRHTLVPLLMLPESRAALLVAKWRASIARTNWLLFAAAIPIVGAILFECIPPLAGVVLAIAVPAQLVFATGLGVLCSVRCGGSGRAVILAISIVLAASIIPIWLAPGAAEPGFWPLVLSSGLSPPTAWWRLAEPAYNSPQAVELGAILFGACIFAAAGLAFAGLALRSFRWGTDHELVPA